MRPNWREIYSNLAHISDRDDELIPVTRETLRLAKGALRKMNEDDYYHNNGAAEQEIIEALKEGPKHPDGTPLTREEVKDSENAYYNDPDGETK